MCLIDENKELNITTPIDVIIAGFTYGCYVVYINYYVVFTDNEEAIATPRLLADEEAEMALSEQIRSGILISLRVFGVNTGYNFNLFFCKSKYGFEKGYMP